MHNAGWLQGTFLDTIYEYGIWVFAAGAMLATLGLTNDPRHILIIGGVSALAYYMTFMLGA
jgi:hypothetical protein